MKNIQTTKKLREKFDQLITQAKNPKTNERDKSENRVQYFIANDPNWKNK
jgi:ribosomal protein L17